MGSHAVKSVGTSASDELAVLIKKLRKEARMTQKQLCTKLNQDVAYISKIERGVRRMDLVELCQIIQALGKAPKDVINEFLDSVPDLR